MDRPFVPILNALDALGAATEWSCAGHVGENSVPYISFAAADMPSWFAAHVLLPHLPGGWLDVDCGWVDGDLRTGLGLYWSGRPSSAGPLRKDFMTADLLAELDAALPRALDGLTSAAPLAVSGVVPEVVLVRRTFDRLHATLPSDELMVGLHEHRDWPTACPDTTRWTLEVYGPGALRQTICASTFAELESLTAAALVTLCAPH